MAIGAKMQLSLLSSSSRKPSLLADQLPKHVLCVEGRKTRNSCCCSTTQHRCRQCPLSVACSLPWAGSLPPSKIPVGGNVPPSSRPTGGRRLVTRPPRMKPTSAGGQAKSSTPLRVSFVTSVQVER